MSDIVLSLSGGGAAGLGHIPVLECLDEMDLTPVAYSGTSMGAIIATCAAAGMRGADLRRHVLDIRDDPLGPIWTFLKGFWRRDRASDLEEALRLVLPEAIPERLEDLEHPIHIVATDYFAREAVVFSEGPLIPILAASAAIPGVFDPVRIGGRWYVDGGVTINLPVGCLPDGVCIASDTSRTPVEDPTEEAPGTLDLMAGCMRILMYGRMQDELDRRVPDVLLQPEGGKWPPLDFGSAAEIIAASDPIKDEMRAKLSALL